MLERFSIIIVHNNIITRREMSTRRNIPEGNKRKYNLPDVNLDLIILDPVSTRSVVILNNAVKSLTCWNSHRKSATLLTTKSSPITTNNNNKRYHNNNNNNDGMNT